MLRRKRWDGHPIVKRIVEEWTIPSSPSTLVGSKKAKSICIPLHITLTRSGGIRSVFLQAGKSPGKSDHQTLFPGSKKKWPTSKPV